MASKKKRKRPTYGGRSQGKCGYECGGFNGEPYVAGWKVSDERWKEIFEKKEAEKDGNQ